MKGEQMSREDNVKGSFFLEFQSHREQVFEAVDASAKFLAQYITEAEAVGIKVILRELLMNAVIHGNKCNGKRLVRSVIEHLEDKRFKIWVEDEGHGFDRDRVADENQDFQYPNMKRGYLLIKRLSDEILFNGKGNRVTVTIEAKI